MSHSDHPASGTVSSKDGTTIAYERTGAGPAVILVDAAGHYRDFSSFDGLIPLLSREFTVYHYDRRGRGASSFDLLASVPVSTLVLDSLGSSDDLTGMAATVAKRMPNATRQSLAGEWHGVPDDVLAPVLTEFFARD